MMMKIITIYWHDKNETDEAIECTLLNFSVVSYLSKMGELGFLIENEELPSGKDKYFKKTKERTVKDALEKTNGNKTKAAAKLGVSVKTIRNISNGTIKL